ncbi:hypothetical protein Xsze_02044 [Xenorhabdus szentirmaii DSM 16338]|nr:hypothetical protein Xsze_02044 [Xenorhabdus szentirmaii DSM 16338]
MGQQVKRAVGVAGGSAFTVRSRCHAMLAVILQFLSDAIGEGDFTQTAINEAGMVRAVLIASFLFQRIGKATQATQSVQLQTGGFTIWCHHGGEALVLVIGVVPRPAIRKQALAQFTVKAVLVFGSMAQRVGQCRQVALPIIMPLPAFTGRQVAFGQLTVFIIIIGKGVPRRQHHFGQCPVCIVVKGGHLP